MTYKLCTLSLYLYRERLQCYMYLHNKSFIITKFLGLLAPIQYASVTRAFRVRVWLCETTVARLLIASSILSSNELDLLSHMMILKTILLVSHTSSHYKYKKKFFWEAIS